MPHSSTQIKNGGAHTHPNEPADENWNTDEAMPFRIGSKDPSDPRGNLVDAKPKSIVLVANSNTTVGNDRSESDDYHRRADYPANESGRSGKNFHGYSGIRSVPLRSPKDLATKQSGAPRASEPRHRE